MTEVERKMQLTRFIREENAMNRMKIKNRENILYGNGKAQYNKEDFPPVYDGYLAESEFAVQPQPTGSSSFGLRVILALLLFGAVVYLDRTGINFNGELAAQVIARQVTASDEAELLDFVTGITDNIHPWQH